MNYSEMLHEFLDSSLNGSGEETLFRALAADEELRFELKYLLKLRDAVDEDDEAYVVPISSTNAIFAKLGYTAPAALVGAAGGIAGAQSGFWTLLKTAGGYLLASVVGALVTTGIFMMNDDSNEAKLATAERAPAAEVRTETGTAPAALGTASAATKGANPNAPANAGTGLNVQRQGTPNATRESIAGVRSNGAGTTRQRTNGSGNAKKTNAANVSTSSEQEIVSAANNKSEAPAASVEANQTPKGVTATSSSRIDSLNVGAVKKTPLTDSESAMESLAGPTTEEHTGKLELPDRFEIEQPKPRRQPTLSVNVRTAVLPFELKSPNTELPETSSGLDNYTVGIAYHIKPHFDAVAEGGKESYLLTFNEHRSDGRVFQHEVMPSVVWAGLGLRYSLSDQSWLNPFVQVLGGGSEAGLIGRTMAGIQLSPNDQFGMMFGLEYNLAMYRFQGETTVSPKLGLNCGITFNLFGN